MKETIGRLWKFANTDISEIFTLDNVKNFAPLVNQISTLFDALNTAWGQLISSSLSTYYSLGCLSP